MNPTVVCFGQLQRLPATNQIQIGRGKPSIGTLHWKPLRPICSHTDSCVPHIVTRIKERMIFTSIVHLLICISSLA
jgi:hypothetical protein